MLFYNFKEILKYITLILFDRILNIIVAEHVVSYNSPGQDDSPEIAAGLSFNAWLKLFFTKHFLACGEDPGG